jgi:hypothetical protein
MAEQQIAMSAPPGLPLDVKSFKQCLQVAYRPSLGDSIRRLDLIEIRQPKLVRLCMDDFFGMTTNPDRLVYKGIDWLGQLHGTFLNVKTGNRTRH